MDIYTVSFFGHRCPDSPLQIERQLEELVLELLSAKAYVEFLVGRDGGFDLLAASVIHRCQRTFRADNSSLVWVLPYPTAEYRNNEEMYRKYYDEIEICQEAAGKHFKAAFQIRNRSMVDRSDLTVFCVQHKSGGSWLTMEYDKQQGIPMVLL
ncbi:MAG: hypothetical protein J6L24_04955 [Oscillospiraceae bacterium]|nr:hypothetical protein [Oscillospiraceae bacterium]